MSKEDELVLGVPADVFTKLGEFTGYIDYEASQDPTVAACRDLEFRRRGDCETDPGFKQLIPYVLVCTKGEGKTPFLLSYSRSPVSGEVRLMGKRSVGIGGHVNPADDAADGDLKELFLRGAVREVEEELGLQSLDPTRLHRLGLLYDPTNEVGHVHVGIVFLLILADGETVTPEAAMHETTFRTLTSLRNEDQGLFERWSQLVISHPMTANLSVLHSAFVAEEAWQG